MPILPKRKRVISIKKIISALLCAAMVCSLAACKGSEGGLKILDCEGAPLAEVSSQGAIKKHSERAYLEIVAEEAVAILSEKLELSESSAKKQLYKGGYTVYTAFDRPMNQALAAACAEREEEAEVAAVITDLSAHLCAAFSSKRSNGQTSYVLQKAPPCSAFKPLSVYAPAIESGVINWSSSYQDTPYKQIRDANGALINWPKNPNKYYSNSKVFISDAVRQSLNTIAVKCLKDYGVENSLKFLEESFQIPLEAEKELLEQRGEEEIIGNIALGSLRSGVSAPDMAGYYQIFANGGKYQAPKAILKLCDAEGKPLYEAQYAPKQVISPATADIMNHMLREVVSPIGTGKNAALKGIEAAGKTGTDDDNKNNWFIGLTPEYSCAFWHGGASKNYAAEIFSSAMNAVYDTREGEREKFRYTSGIRLVICCAESGDQFHPGCPLINNGYYASDDLPKLCNQH